jgi:2-polyprenyl-3-methyl-5-hydroxy-6-metoxy-1,4-benzoquinol methylase
METDKIAQLHKTKYWNIFMKYFGHIFPQINTVNFTNTDGEIYVQLNKIKSQNSGESQDSSESQKWLQLKAQKTIKILRGAKFNTYLDYGCGNGALTCEIAKLLNCVPHGCDVFEELPCVNYIKISDFNNDDRVWDLISCFMCIHHFSDQISTLTILAKKCKYLLIREHNSPNADFGLFLDIQHDMYTHVLNSDEHIMQESGMQIPGKFVSQRTLQRLLEKCGFKLIRTFYNNDLLNTYYELYESRI